MQPLQNYIGPTIRIGREILCLPYAGFFLTRLDIKDEAKLSFTELLIFCTTYIVLNSSNWSLNSVYRVASWLICDFSVFTSSSRTLI